MLSYRVYAFDNPSVMVRLEIPPCLDILRRISRAMAIVRHRHAIRSRDRGPPVVGISDGWILRSPPASGLDRYNPVWTIDTDKMIYNRSLELQY